MHVIQMCWKSRKAVTVSKRSADSKETNEPDTPGESTGKMGQRFRLKYLGFGQLLSAAGLETINGKHLHRKRDREMVKPGPPEDRGQSKKSHVQMDIAIQ